MSAELHEVESVELFLHLTDTQSQANSTPPEKVM